MKEAFILRTPFTKFSLWEKLRNANNRQPPISFELELTARCNLNCRHCYINLPVKDNRTRQKEISLYEIKRIVDEAVSLGALCCRITGGEPLLRNDFFEIYLYLKKKGLLVSVFTNATLIKRKHGELFKEYPPRDIEITVYGVTKETYEKVTRKSGSFKAVMNGTFILLKNDIKIRFKTMALRSNIKELPRIAKFCRKRTKDYFRFDPFINLRFDGNKKRNTEINSERLSPREIIALEQRDFLRREISGKICDKRLNPLVADCRQFSCQHLFHCAAGMFGFSVSYDGIFRLCSSLGNRDCSYDLKSGSLKEAWYNFVPKVRELKSDRKEFIEKCRKCSIINLCMWCPANTYLETGKLDEFVEYFCEIAHARAKMFSKRDSRWEKRKFKNSF